MNKINNFDGNETNLIELLKQALLFYADDSNYSSSSGEKSRIMLDNGTQAKFALDQITKIEGYLNDFDQNYNNYIEEIKNKYKEENEN